MLFGKNELAVKIAELKEHSEIQIKELKQAVDAVKSGHDTHAQAQLVELQQLRMNFSEEIEKISAALDGIRLAREEVEKTSRSFQDVQRKVEKIVYDQLSAAIRDNIERLETDLDRYHSVKRDIDTVVVRMNEMSGEISKFKSISSEIKSADFTLSSYAAELEKNDSEKLRLMKEVDDLQRLVSRMRRGSR